MFLNETYFIVDFVLFVRTVLGGKLSSVVHDFFLLRWRWQPGGGTVGWGTCLFIVMRTKQGLHIEEEEEEEEVWRGFISVCSIKSMCLGAEAPD